jgi:hypothetical protein
MVLRLAYAKLWFDDARSVGGDEVVRPCAICKAQLNAVLPKLNQAEKTTLGYTGLMDLVYKAIVPSSLPGSADAPKDDPYPVPPGSQRGEPRDGPLRNR